MLIATAYAQETGAAASQGSTLMSLMPLILMFVVLYFLMIRPQQKKMKEHRAMVEALAKNDEVVTQGGVAGTVTEIGENFLRVEVCEGTQLCVQRNAVVSVLPKGTLKNL